jgi:hypothetical protein
VKSHVYYFFNLSIEEEAEIFLKEIARNSEETPVFIEQVYKTIDKDCTTISLMEFFEGISVAFDFEDLTNISQLRKLYLKHDSENKKTLNKDEFVKFLLEVFVKGFEHFS